MVNKISRVNKPPLVWGLIKLPFQSLRSKLLKIFLQNFDHIKQEGNLNNKVICLDVGGITKGFETLGNSCRAIAVNLVVRESVEGWDFILADGRFLPFRDGAVDIVICSAVLEHVHEGREELAREIKRVSKGGYFISVPYLYAPIESHYLVPFFQFVPESIKKFLLFKLGLRIGWMSKRNYEEIKLLRKSHLKDLFPEAQIRLLRLFGIPLSLVALRNKHDCHKSTK